jgi:hypothetical protein
MYRSIIINLLGEKVGRAETIVSEVINKYSAKLSEDGTVWIITENYLENNNLVFSSFIIANKIDRYKLRNIILVPHFDKNKAGVFFKNNSFEILFFSKGDKYFFNKDPIREKHIWKDVEWGKRKKNYHTLGKAPGNVWLKTEDDGKGKIIRHIPLSFEESIERIIKSTVEEGDECLTVNVDKNFNNIIEGVKINNDST